MSMKIAESIIAVAVIMILCSFAKAQEDTGTSFSLKQAQDYAVENNINVKNSEIDAQIAQKKVWEYISMGLPSVSAQANYQHIDKVPEMNFGGYIDWAAMDPSVPLTSMDILGNYVEGEPIKLGTKDNLTIDLTLSQLIFSGEFYIGLSTAKTYKKLKIQTYEKSTRDIKTDVSSAYFTVLILEENARNLGESKISLENTLKEIEAINKAGFIDETDVDQLKLTVKNMENAIASLKQNIELAYKLLQLQMGLSPETKPELTDKLEDLITGTDIPGLAGKPLDYDSNIDYLILETSEDLTSKQVKLARASYYPTIAGFYRHQEQVNAPEFNFNPPDLIGVRMDIPILSSGQRWAKVQQAKMELDKTRNQKELVRQSIGLEFEKARAEMQTAFSRYGSEKENMELAKRIYDRMLIKFREGVGSSSELTQAHNQYISTQANYFNAIYELLSAKNKLDRVLNNY